MHMTPTITHAGAIIAATTTATAAAASIPTPQPTTTTTATIIFSAGRVGAAAATAAVDCTKNYTIIKRVVKSSKFCEKGKE